MQTGSLPIASPEPRPLVLGLLNNSRALPELVVCSTHTPANELVSFTRHKLAPFNRRLWDFYLALNGRDVSQRVETPLFNERSRHCL